MNISSVTRGQDWKKEMREIQLSEILFTISVVVIEWAFLRDFQVETVKENWVNDPRKGDGRGLNPLSAKCPTPELKWGQHAVVLQPSVSG